MLTKKKSINQASCITRRFKTSLHSTIHQICNQTDVCLELQIPSLDHKGHTARKRPSLKTKLIERPTTKRKKGITKSESVTPNHGEWLIQGKAPPASSTKIMGCKGKNNLWRNWSWLRRWQGHEKLREKGGVELVVVRWMMRLKVVLSFLLLLLHWKVKRDCEEEGIRSPSPLYSFSFQ